MATRQYIGARYVPVIMGPWDAQQEYEPLSVVLYNNSSYTSKRQVPAGIAPTDTAFWALTGNYNAQIDEFAQAFQEYVDTAVRRFNSLVDMVGDMSVHLGDVIRTLGYYDENDGGSALYLVRLALDTDIYSATTDGSTSETGLVRLAANYDGGVLVAELIVEDFVNLRQFGAVGNDDVDDSAALFKTITYAVEHAKSVFIPAGIYAIYQDTVFQTASLGVTYEGLCFFGESKNSSVLKLMTEGTAKWFYDSTSIQNYMRTTFTDIGFTADDPTLGNGFKAYSTGGDKQLRFFRCDFVLATVLSTSGTGNADLNRFDNCTFTTYDDAFISNNGQSVDNILSECGGVIYKNLIRIIAGGNYKILGGAFDLYAYNGDSSVSYIYNADGSAVSFGNGDTTFDCVRFEFHGEKGFFNGGDHSQVNCMFRRCSLGTQYGSPRTVVNLYDNNILTFKDCVLSNNLAFNVDCNFLSGATTSGGVLKFDGCNIGGALDFSEKITKTGDSYTIIATGCFRANGALSTRSVQDFAFMSKNSGLSGICNATKTAFIKNVGTLFPTPDGNNDIVIAVPKGIFIKRIYLYKPAIAASSQDVVFYVGTDDKSVVIAQSAANKTWNDEIIMDATDYGEYSYNRIRVWSSSLAGPGISGGYIYFEYI